MLVQIASCRIKPERKRRQFSQPVFACIRPLVNHCKINVTPREVRCACESHQFDLQSGMKSLKTRERRRKYEAAQTMTPPTPSDAGDSRAAANTHQPPTLH